MRRQKSFEAQLELAHAELKKAQTKVKECENKISDIKRQIDDRDMKEAFAMLKQNNITVLDLKSLLSKSQNQTKQRK